MNKIPIYMMPGLGTSPKIFEYLKLPENYEVIWMKWLSPISPNEKLTDYANRLILEKIKHDNPIVLGVSFGGIVAQEISKQIQVKKLILISTVKSHKEFSPFLKSALKYKLYRFFPSRAMTYVDFWEKIAFNKKFKQKMRLYQRYMDFKEKKYLDWSIKALLQWKQSGFSSTPFIHIHGTEDKVFPIQYIQEPVMKVEGGRHDMIVFKHRWFNENWDNIL